MERNIFRIPLHAFKYIEYAMVWSVALALFLFTLKISTLPVGDDPGYHSMVLRMLLKTGNIHFEIPFFPSLHQTWGSERFVTPFIVAGTAKIIGHVNVLLWPKVFAALCMSLSLVPIYSLIKKSVGHVVPAIAGIIFLATTKFYQENFWEGSYEQYTGLLALVTLLWMLQRCYASNKLRYLISSFLILAILFKTHQLGFLVGLSLVGVTTVWYLYTQHAQKLFWTVLGVSTIGAVLLFPKFTQGFAVNTVDYPIYRILSTSEGVVPLAALLIITGFFSVIRWRRWDVLLFTAITIVYSQSTYLNVPFYAFRFNLYFTIAMALCLAFGIQFVTILIQRNQVYTRRIWTPLLAVFLVVIILPQLRYTYGVWEWLSSPTRNPASVILQSDIEALQWAESHTDPQSVFVAPLKWGYYIPAIADRAVILTDAVGGDTRDARYSLAQKAHSIFIDNTAKNASHTMKELNARYIYVSSSIHRFPDRYPNYTTRQFENRTYFKRVYEKDNVSIYEVL